MGGFLFLRFINPAIVTPEFLAINDNHDNDDPAFRRGLIFVTKLFQSLANNLRFEQPGMRGFNDFLDANVVCIREA